MTDKLREAFEKANDLPDDQQDVLAALILREIEDEARWDATFEHSQHVLQRLADEAYEEDQKGLKSWR